MLKALIAKFSKTLLRPKHNLGYKTTIYLTFGEPLSIHDTLDFGPAVNFSETEHFKEFWRDDESNEAIQSGQDWPEHDMESEQLIHINPTSGLIMMDDCMDIAGNLYGTNEIDTEFLSEWI
ncbi:MAG: hypothetical protein ACI9DH_000474 [Halioglobus sp.]|jgi:hypothetical protein